MFVCFSYWKKKNNNNPLRILKRDKLVNCKISFMTQRQPIYSLHITAEEKKTIDIHLFIYSYV